MLETFDPVETIDKMQAALDATANALLRAEVAWQYNGQYSAGIVTDETECPLCVIVRRRDAEHGIDESRVYLPEMLWRAAPGYDGTGNYTGLNQLLGDVTEQVAGALAG